MDIFSVETWRKFDWLRRIRDGAPVDDFYEPIASLLKDGLEFHDELARMEPIANALYFFSRDYSTPKGVKVILSDSGYKSVSVYEDYGGDGRVPTDIAKYWERVRNPDVHRQLKLEHGDLPKDDIFIEFVDSIVRLAIEKANADIATMSLGDSDLRRAFVDENVLLEVPLDPERLRSSHAEQILRFNKQVISEIQDRGLKTTPAYWAYEKARRSSDRYTRAQLYAMSFRFAGDSSVAFWASRNLGHLLYEMGQHKWAKAYTQESIRVSLARSKEDPERWNTRLASSYNNLGAIAYALNERDKAREYFETSDKLFPDGKARANLERLYGTDTQMKTRTGSDL